MDVDYDWHMRFTSAMLWNFVQIPHDRWPWLSAVCVCWVLGAIDNRRTIFSIQLKIARKHKKSNCRVLHEVRPPPNEPSEFDRFACWLDIEWIHSSDNNGSTARPRTCPSPEIFSDVSANRCFQTNPSFDCVTCVISFNLSLSLAIYLIDRDFEVN